MSAEQDARRAEWARAAAEREANSYRDEIALMQGVLDSLVLITPLGVQTGKVAEINAMAKAYNKLNSTEMLVLIFCDNNDGSNTGCGAISGAAKSDDNPKLDELRNSIDITAKTNDFRGQRGSRRN